MAQINPPPSGAHPDTQTNETRHNGGIMNDTARTYTVIGVWQDDEPIPVGVVAGQHEVTGGNEQAFPQGLWAASVTADSAEGAEITAKIQMRGKEPSEPGDEYTVVSPAGRRLWHADSEEHAREQHEDAFPDEPIVLIVRGEFVPMISGSTMEDG